MQLPKGNENKPLECSVVKILKSKSIPFHSIKLDSVLSYIPKIKLKDLEKY